MGTDTEEKICNLFPFSDFEQLAKRVIREGDEESLHTLNTLKEQWQLKSGKGRDSVPKDGVGGDEIGEEEVSATSFSLTRLVVLPWGIGGDSGGVLEVAGVEIMKERPSFDAAPNPRVLPHP